MDHPDGALPGSLGVRTGRLGTFGPAARQAPTATDAFLVYASHLLAGHVDPKTVHVTWFIPRPEVDLVALLQQAASTRDIRGALKQVAPAAPAYGRLKGALAEYRAIASRGGWPRLPAGARLRAGDRDARVVVIRRRLAATNPGMRDQTSEWLDDDLRQSVEMFQRFHGLVEDGVVGPGTRRALNVSVEERIAQIRINLERWRWLPLHFGSSTILQRQRFR
ncbi:MAG: peptidoglycan-binding protein [Acidobacteriota bacterium]